ncbi:MAG TPA: dihydroorotate dehydrogenase-like protein [Prolixibacteraceae bacterium]|nr:dihydroorotate dehydrogenase-like protein [Prolixibacteraceae bacterium]HPS12137.1 dihydroorotate dehydrogenase-like protein [Prolixibacteraceae bacterium]
MADLSTRFFGLDLKNPVIIGSSGLTSSVEKIKMLEENGAGAVVLKSIFEEEIYNEYQHLLKNQEINDYNQEYFDYFDYEIRNDQVKNYLDLISNVKKAGVKIPVVASINCMTGSEWVFFAQKLELAGADALELNLFVLPSDLSRNAEDVRQYYFKIINMVLEQVTIPVSVKISNYFSDLALMIKELSETKIAGITLFNRFYNIDIDLEKKELVPAQILSHPYDYLQPLRWIGIMSGRVDCELAASTGIHDHQAAIKMLMSGASAVQVVSAVYKNGYGFVKEMVKGISDWMDANGYKNIKDLSGAASAQRVNNPAMYERVQFMKYFGGYDIIEE